MQNADKKVPEDILSSVEREHEGTVVTKRTGRKIAKKEGKKVIVFMLVFILLITAAGLSWIFFPDILSYIQKEEGAPVRTTEVPIPSKPSAIQTNQEIDTDRDGLSDIQEQGLGLDINNPDTDSDGLSDRDEVDIYNTNPRVADTDGDSISDGDEVNNGSNPNGEGRLDDISAVVNLE